MQCICNEQTMGEDSPKNKVKFLCSYAGKVLPRPSDGLLRYVGGETRVVSVPRDVTFSELMKKVGSMVEGEVVLKYQLVPEDLDALVSVRTEEDVKHMIQEHDRHHTGRMLRAFLFPPARTALPASEPYLLEQRYIDAINGILRTSPRAPRGSACSSPKSISPDAVDLYSPVFANSNSNSNCSAMQRVRSSPSLSNMSGLDQQGHYQQQQQQHHVPFHNCPPSFTSRPPQDPQIGRLGGRGASFNYHYSNTRQPHRGGYGYPDDSAAYANAHLPLHSLSRSPRRKSVWD